MGHSLFAGVLDSFTPWQPGLDSCHTKECFQGIRIDGKRLKFEPKCCDWFCTWIKNKLLNTISFGFYGCCCGGNRKLDLWMDKQIVLEGHEDGETIYYAAKVPAWANILYAFGNLIFFWFTLRPFMILWYAKQRCKSMKFGGQDIRIEGASYCEFWKLYWCKCGGICSAKLKLYLDEHTVIGKPSNTVQVMGALKGAVAGKIPGMGGGD